MISATANDAMMARAAAAAAAHHSGAGTQAPARRGGVGQLEGTGSSILGISAVGRLQGRSGEDVRRSSAVGGGRTGDTATDLDAGRGAGVSPSLVGIEDDLLVETGSLVTERDAASLEELIWHPSDTAVKPIVANRRIGKWPSWER